MRKSNRQVAVTARILASACLAGLFVSLQLAGCGGDDSGGTGDDGGTSDGATLDATGGGSCASPLLACGATCVDARNDPSNCGACGKACDAGLVCSSGSCVVSCPSGQQKCDVGGKAACVTTDTDRANCGACGKACAAGEVCSAGKCALTCSTGYSACSGAPYIPPPPDAGSADAGDAMADAADDAMPDAADDAMADGAADAMSMVDAAPPVDAGSPVPYCANLQTDEDNCGVCGLACDYNTKCSRGLCCTKGTQNCGGTCTDTRHDANNCGGCGIVCPNDKPHCGGSQCTTLSTFTGVMNDVPIANLGGWEQCYLDTFDHDDLTLAADIQAACTGANILVACRETGSDTLKVAAHAPRDDVFFDTGTSNTTHSANGVGWYFNGNWSMGYAADGDPVERDECDTLSSPNATSRLCFHTLSEFGGGYRCGEVQDLNESNQYERIIFQAN